MKHAVNEKAARAEFERRLRRFVRDLSGERVIRKNTPLFETGTIDSMRVLDLIVLLEEMIGRRIADEEIVLGSFRTIDAICTTFFAEARTSVLRPAREAQRR